MLIGEPAVPCLPCLWWIDVRGDGTTIQRRISKQGALYGDCHRRTRYDSLGLFLRYVVLAYGYFPYCRDYHAEISKVVVLGGDGCIHLCVCWTIDCPDIKSPVLLITSQAG